MRSFKLLREFYCFSGIVPPQSQPNRKCLLNFKNVLILVSMLQYLMTTASFLLFKTASIKENGISFYGAISVFVFSPSFLLTIYKSADIFELMNKFEKFIEQSELRQIFLYVGWNWSVYAVKIGQSDSASHAVNYNELNGKIERICRLIYITTAQCSTPGIIAPSFLITAVNYFVYDLSDESFYISCQMMCVVNRLTIKKRELIFRWFSKVAIRFENTVRFSVGQSIVYDGRVCRTFLCHTNCLLFDWLVHDVHFICKRYFKWFGAFEWWLRKIDKATSELDCTLFKHCSTLRWYKGVKYTRRSLHLRVSLHAGQHQTIQFVVF